MSNSHRRYEILLPLEFNDGTQVADELFADALLELREKFGAVSSKSQATQGQWQQEGQVYRDQLIRIYADVPDRRSATTVQKQPQPDTTRLRQIPHASPSPFATRNSATMSRGTHTLPMRPLR